MQKTVGEFTMDIETGAISGPARFMGSDHYEGWKARLLRGQDPVVNAGLSPDFYTGVLVSLQTCYAGWRGMEELLHVLDRAPRTAPHPVTVR